MLNKTQVRILENLAKEFYVDKMKKPFYDENITLATNGCMILGIKNKEIEPNKHYSTHIYRLINCLLDKPTVGTVFKISKKELSEILKYRKNHITIFNNEHTLYILDDEGCVIYTKEGDFNDFSQVTLNVKFVRRVLNFTKGKELTIKLGVGVIPTYFYCDNYISTIFPILVNSHDSKNRKILDFIKSVG